tara:strand:+ start:443 stop:628 length:186 start_codon:yes stop_codon:yes gene_type:complete
MIILFIQNVGWMGWVIIGLAVLLLFGGKKIPELMRGTGKGIKEFKKGLKEVDEEESSEKKS